MHSLALLSSIGASIFLILALALAFGFECVNGFHDTANAVATVIYTNTLKPWIAVVWSGIWNLIGVLTSSGAVAFGIVALLPVELVINVGSATNQPAAVDRASKPVTMNRSGTVRVGA